MADDNFAPELKSFRPGSAKGDTVRQPSLKKRPARTGDIDSDLGRLFGSSKPAVTLPGPNLFHVVAAVLDLTNDELETILEVSNPQFEAVWSEERSPDRREMHKVCWLLLFQLCEFDREDMLSPDFSLSQTVERLEPEVFGVGL